MVGRTRRRCAWRTPSGTGARIADAWSAAHKHGVVHRDLKPANIMLTKSGAKVLDFGLAKLTPGALDFGGSIVTAADLATLPGAVMGTVPYMAPEQLEGRDADSRADIWAFGCLLYEMLTGRPAFPGETTASVISAIMTAEPAPLGAADRLAPQALARLVRQCLVKDRNDRFQSIHDVLIGLRWLEEEAHVDPSEAPPTPRWLRRRSAGAAAVAAVLLATLAFSGVAWFARSGSGPDAKTVIRFQISPPPGRRFWNKPAVSPDGRRVVFVTLDDDARSQLWLRPLDASEARPLPGTNRGKFPFWSPDGRSIAFFADGRLQRLDLAGGAPVTICEATDGRGGTWNGKGVILFSPSISSSLMRVPASGGHPVSSTVLDASIGDTSHRFPEFLPDGDHFIYWAMNRDTARSRIRSASLSSTGVRDLLQAEVGEYANGFTFFTRELKLLAQSLDPLTGVAAGAPISIADEVDGSGTLGLGNYAVSPADVIVFGGAARESAQLTWIARDGRPLADVGPAAVQDSPSLSPDGRRVAIARGERRQSGIWVIDLARGGSTRVTPDGVGALTPVWSPDGRAIAFASPRGPAGSVNIYRVPADEIGAVTPMAEAICHDVAVRVDTRRAHVHVGGGRYSADRRPLDDARRGRQAAAVASDGLHRRQRSTVAGRTVDRVFVESNGPPRDLRRALPGPRRTATGVRERWHAAAMATRRPGVVLPVGRRSDHCRGCSS